VSASPDIGADPVVAALRERISAEDRAILEALNRRIELVAELKRHKDRSGYAFHDAGREARMLEELRAANRGALPSDAVEELLRTVLALTKRAVAGSS
jgi:chorismate mutase